MKLSNRDLRKLLPPLLATLALFVAAGSLAWWSQMDALGATQEKNRATESRNRIETRLRQFSSEELDLKQRGELMRRLQASGVLGEEQRLDWMEQLRSTQRELRLPGLKYEFAAQSPLKLTPPAGYTWFNSPLRLQLRLLHEGDLLNAIDRIQHDAKALVIARSCKLAPPAAPTERREAPAMLNAECEMDWLTAHRPHERP